MWIENDTSNFYDIKLINTINKVEDPVYFNTYYKDGLIITKLDMEKIKNSNKIKKLQKLLGE